MSMQVNNNVNIDWSTLLGKLDAATKAAETQIAGGVVNGQNITVTTQINGTDRAITLPIPDDLDLPGQVDQAAIDALCAKLAGDTSLGLSEEDVKAVHALLSETLAAAAPGLSAAAAKGASKTVMFDLYKLMALLVEIGQKQRDATRELRSAQSQQIQKSIQDQASQQRTAALAGMIGSLICCAVQVGFSLYTLRTQTSAFKEQLGTLDSTGVSSARENLSMMKAADTPQHAQAQLTKVTNEVGNKPSGVANRTIAQEVSSGFEKSTVSGAKFRAQQIRLTSEAEKYQRLANPEAPLQPGDVRPDSNMAKAQAKLAAFDQKSARIAELEAKGAELGDNGRPKGLNFAETRELVELKQGLGNRETLVQEVAAGRQQLATECQTNMSDASTKLADLKTQFRDDVKTDLQRYQDEYDAALRDSNGITKDTPKAEATRIRNDLQLAADKLKFARACAYDKLADPNFKTDAARAADIKAAGLAVDAAERGRADDIGYIEATRTLQAGEAKLGIINAIGNAGQNFVQGLSSYLQAETKESEAAQTQMQEELDQTKDLFAQAQSLVDAVIQLMQAVSSAETQSMRDAIQA